jgi:hypothetical protein
MPGYFSDYQIDIGVADAPTASAISSNVIDLGPVGTNTLRTLPGPRQQWVEIFVSETVTSGTGGSTVTFSLESDSTTNLATSPTVHESSPAIVKTALTAGTYVYLAVQPDQTYERYVGVRFTNSANLTAGKFTSRLVDTKVVGNVLTYANGKLAP